MEKYQKGNIWGLDRHYRRANERYGNENIDLTRSHLNYDLTGHTERLQDRVKGRIAELNLPRKVRRDAVVMCSFVVSLSREDVKRLGKVGCDKYFANTYKFFCDRYGDENVVSAMVHWDETNPHMHLCLVPVNKKGRLSAKSLFSRVEDPTTHEVFRNDLEDLQDDFWASVGKEIGLERGVPSTRKHLDERAYKQAQDKETAKFNAVNADIVNIISKEEPEYFTELVNRIFPEEEKTQTNKKTQGGRDEGR